MTNSNNPSTIKNLATPSNKPPREKKGGFIADRPTPPKLKKGRPTVYKPEYCEKLIAHMKKGYSFESFAADTNSTIDSLYDWLRQHEDFVHAKRKGDALCLKWWEKQHKKGMWQDFSEGAKRLHMGAWMFNMKARFGWRDTDPQVTNQITIASSNQNIAELTAQALNTLMLKLNEACKSKQNLLEPSQEHLVPSSPQQSDSE